MCALFRTSDKLETGHTCLWRRTTLSINPDEDVLLVVKVARGDGAWN